MTLYAPCVGDRVRLALDRDNAATYAAVVEQVYRYCGVRLLCDSGEERYLSADEFTRRFVERVPCCCCPEDATITDGMEANGVNSLQR